MRHLRFRVGGLVLGPVLFMIFGAADSCTPNGTAKITYRQVGACNGYKDEFGAHSAGPGHAFVVFKVRAIDNTQGTVDFAFDPQKLLTGADGDRIDPNLTLARLIGVLQVAPTTIPKGKLVGLDGFGVATVSTAAANGAAEANNTSYLLRYETGSSDPGILFDKENASQTSWPVTENCLSIAF